jgi:hypothetical protein
MRFAPVLLSVVLNEVTVQPQIGFGFVFGRVEVIERLVRSLDRAEWTLDLAPLARAVTRLPSFPRGICTRASTPSCPITARNTRDFVIGPLSA